MSYVKDIRLVQRGWKEQGNQGAYIIILYTCACTCMPQSLCNFIVYCKVRGCICILHVALKVQYFKLCRLQGLLFLSSMSPKMHPDGLENTRYYVHACTCTCMLVGSVHLNFLCMHSVQCSCTTFWGWSSQKQCYLHVYVYIYIYMYSVCVCMSTKD